MTVITTGSTIEQRFLPAAEIRLLEPEGSNLPTIVGYAAKFNVRSHDLGGFFEIIRPTAFTRCLAGSPDVRALVDHRSEMIIGRTLSGTMRLLIDDVGLQFEIDPPDTTVGRNLVVSMRRKDLDGMSFAFNTRQDQWGTNAAGEVVRELLDVDLSDVSVVTYPAYPRTEVALRSLEAYRSAQKPPAAGLKLQSMQRRLQLAELRD